jgi:hypothetical protein
MAQLLFTLLQKLTQEKLEENVLQRPPTYSDHQYSMQGESSLQPLLHYGQ